MKVERGSKTIPRVRAIALVWIGLSIPAGLRADSFQSPVEIVRARNEAVEELVRSAGDDPDAETKEKLKDIINDLMDFRELSRRALGKHWEERDEPERADFVHVFRGLIRNSSVKKLSIYKADRVTYEEGEIRDGKVAVNTVAYKDRKGVEIVYRMHQVDGEWKVYDVLIDGASTARTYRDSFYKQIAKSSYPEMYEKLAKKLAEEA